MRRATARWIAALSPALAVAAALSVVTALGIYRLRGFPYAYQLNAAVLRDAFSGIVPILPQTGWAALKVWSFWGWSAAVIGGLLLTIDPALGMCDAILGGAAGVWVLAYPLGNLLGPIGLFRAPVIWALLAAGMLWLWRRPPEIRIKHISAGQKLALISFALFALITIPVQLGSPVVPFADSLAPPAAAQRILTFHLYAPFDNDPYGLWGPFAQTPALELFYAILAIGSHTRLAVLAESAAMIPMGGLLIFATYRLGRTLLGDAAGGIASLLVFSTALCRGVQGMRGTAVDFALVGIGLGLFLDSRRSSARLAIGAVVLGACVASQPLYGVFAIACAAGWLGLWLIGGERTAFLCGVGALLGALLFAAPVFPIALAISVPYPILPLCQIVGVAVAMLAAKRLVAGGFESLSMGRFAVAAIAGLLLALMLIPEISGSLEISQWLYQGFPLLAALCVAGLIVMLAQSWVDPKPAPYAAIAGAALLIPLAASPVFKVAQSLFTAPGANLWRLIFDEVRYKLADWCFYFVVFPAALPFALLRDRGSKPFALFAILAALIFPWRVTDPNQLDWQWHYQGHSILELLAFNLNVAGEGYWADAPNSHWVLDNAEFSLVDFLNREIDAGRITMHTHILHLTRNAERPDFIQYSAFTGIDDDPIEYSYDPNNQFHSGSRIRPISYLPEALARRPEYVLDELSALPGVDDSLAGYELVFRRDRARLFRRRGSANHP